jgi:adenine-specific DNA-methyltransferase
MKATPTYQQLRGGYYTPKYLAEFLTRWAVRTRSDYVLEPSCGDGVFIKTVADRLTELGTSAKWVAKQVVGCELDQFEAVRAAERLLAKGVRRAMLNIICGDFFLNAESLKGRFQAAVGNPPFIRYQNFPEEQRVRAFALMRTAGLRPNGLTNAWVPFVVASALALDPTGRLAMVVPAELLQVGYAAELRAYLGEAFSRITVVTFRELAFEGIQQEIVLLLCEKGNSASSIEVLELQNTAELHQYDPSTFPLNGFKRLDRSNEKWTQYYLSQSEIDLLRGLRSEARLTRLGNIAHTDIGIVTGNNDVFVVSAEEARKRGLERHVQRLVGRSSQMGGLILHKSDWESNAELGQRAFLLNLPPLALSKLPAGIRRYIEEAESAGHHKGYKCSIRKVWYQVPSVYVPDAFLLRQVHSYPKLVVNEASATCTDTIHRVRFKRKIEPRRLAATFLNSMTFAFAEILGRSYGGGVLELEPSEADLLPIVLDGDGLDAVKLDRLLRNEGIEAVLSVTNQTLHRGAMQLRQTEIETLTAIWCKLRDRRIGRRGERLAKQSA